TTPRARPPAEVKPVLARCGKRRWHFGGAAYECHHDKADKRLAHSECLRRLLHRLDENLADQRHEQGDYRQRDQSQPYGPRRFAFLGALSASKYFPVRLK